MVTIIKKKNRITDLKVGTRKIKTMLISSMFAIALIPVQGLATGIDTGVPEVNNMFKALNQLIEGIVVGVGTLILLFGIFRFGMSFQSQDASDRSRGILFIISGLIIALAPTIIKLFIK